MDRFVRKKSDAGDDADPTVEQQQQASGPYHSVLVEERTWTANWINQYVFIKLYKYIHGNFLLDCLLMMLI